MNQNHQSFITEYLRHRSPFTAYCLAYNLKDCSNYESIMSSANRLMNNEEVGGTIRSILDNIRHEIEQEVLAEMKQEVLTIQRKRELLASIATGEMVAIQNYKGKDCNVCTQMVRPTINQMLRAIDLDNKMVGLYPVYNRQSAVEKVPKPQQFTTNSGITENASPRNLSRNGREGDRGTLEQDNPEKNTPIGNKTQQSYLSPHNMSPLQGDRGTLSQDNPEENTPIGNKSQQSDLSPQNMSPLQGDRGTLSQDNPEKNTPTGNKSQQFEKNNISIGNNSQQSEIENTSTGNKTQQTEPLRIEPLRINTPLLSLISPRRG